MLENFLGARKGPDGPMGWTLRDDTWVGEVENQQDFAVQVTRLSVFWVVLLSFFFSILVSVFFGDLEKNMGPKEKGHSRVTKKK